MVDIKLVIARYNEKIDWIKSPNHVIYNKGNQLNDPTKIVIEMPNVGREGHTYLTHIVKNYNNLSDYTVFLQGDPFPHSGNLSLNLSKIITGSLAPFNLALFVASKDALLFCCGS